MVKSMVRHIWRWKRKSQNDGYFQWAAPEIFCKITSPRWERWGQPKLLLSSSSLSHCCVWSSCQSWLRHTGCHVLNSTGSQYVNCNELQGAVRWEQVHISFTSVHAIATSQKLAVTYCGLYATVYRGPVEIVPHFSVHLMLALVSSQ